MIYLGETIEFIREAGIKVWVLTGDKIETAVTIGFSSGLLDNSMKQYQLITTDEELAINELRNI